MLRCFDGTFYVGVTNNVERRLGEHQYGIDPKAYTFKRRPLELVAVSEFKEVEQAIRWEKQLKGWTHRKKLAYCRGRWDEVKRFSIGTEGRR